VERKKRSCRYWDFGRVKKTAHFGKVLSYGGL
jgi:hypothetical protein